MRWQLSTPGPTEASKLGPVMLKEVENYIATFPDVHATSMHPYRPSDEERGDPEKLLKSMEAVKAIRAATKEVVLERLGDINRQLVAAAKAAGDIAAAMTGDTMVTCQIQGHFVPEKSPEFPEGIVERFQIFVDTIRR